MAGRLDIPQRAMARLPPFAPAAALARAALMFNPDTAPYSKFYLEPFETAAGSVPASIRRPRRASITATTQGQAGGVSVEAIRKAVERAGSAGLYPAPAHRLPRAAICRATGHSPTKTSRVSRSLDCSPERNRAAGNQPKYRQKPLILHLYLEIPRKAIQLLQQYRHQTDMARFGLKSAMRLGADITIASLRMTVIRARCVFDATNANNRPEKGRRPQSSDLFKSVVMVTGRTNPVELVADLRDRFQIMRFRGAIGLVRRVR